MELRDQLFAFEIEQGLFAARFRGVKFWDPLRSSVYWEIAAERGMVAPRIDIGAYRKSRRFGSLLREGLRLPRLIAGAATRTRSPACDLLFFESDVKRLVDGHLVDYRGYPFVCSVARDLSVVTVDPSRLTESVAGIYPGTVVSSRVQHLRAGFLANTARLDLSERALLTSIAARVRERFGGTVAMEACFRQLFLPQYFMRPWLARLMRARRPAVVGFLNDARKQAVIEVAHELNIPSFEVQHGNTSAVDLVTSYPDEITTLSPETIPDYILTFGEYWNARYRNPSRKIAVGFPYLERQRAELLARPFNRDAALVIGISVEDTVLGHTMMTLARSLPEHRFYFKLRASEYACWRQIYGDELGTVPNLTIIDRDERPLYEYFMESRYLLTTNSTAIWEGLALGVIPIVLKRGYFEDVMDLVSAGHALLAENAEEVVRLLLQRTLPQRVDAEAIFASGSEETMRRVVRNLVDARRV